MARISVIIPVYNVEEYLERSINSLLNQTIQDLEFIFIDDKSTDRSLEILKNYAKRDPRIIVIEENHRGPGSTRNRGLEVARGDYIQFLDPDDFYEPECCEKMLSEMENSEVDIAVFGTTVRDQSDPNLKVISSPYHECDLEGDYNIDENFIRNYRNVNCWNKIYKKSFLKENNIKFPEDKFNEDVYFFWKCMFHAKKIKFVKNKLINYMVRSGSIVQNVTIKPFELHLDAIDVFARTLAEIPLDKREVFETPLFHDFHLRLKWLIDSLPCENFKDKQKIIEETSSLLKRIDKRAIKALPELAKLFFDRIEAKDFYYFNAFDTFTYNREIKPVYNDNFLAILFSVDHKFVKYFSVTLQSIISNCQDEIKYDILVIENDLNISDKRLIISMIPDPERFSIRFIRINNIRKKIGVLTDNANLGSIACYSRLLAPYLLSKYKKILYLDSDVIVNSSLKELADLNIDNYTIAAVRDYYINSQIDEQHILEFKKYAFTVLNIYDTTQYFNSGVMLLNIERYTKTPIEDILDVARRNTKFYNDQNVLNSVFKENVTFLSPLWNVQINATRLADIPNVLHFRLDPDIKKLILGMHEDLPKILHYSYRPKPWQKEAGLDYCYYDVWWKYAKLSPFYYSLLQDLLKDKETIVTTTTPIVNTTSIQTLSIKKYIYYKLQHGIYSLLYRLSYGNLRQKFLTKKEIVKKSKAKIYKEINL